MAILAVARDVHDLRKRLGMITAAYSRDGEPVTAEDLGAAGAMTVLLKDAIKPNLIQTLEGQPCLMHAGPFANIAHGNSSLIADLLGLKLGEYVVTESGFGSDMGMEKFIDIVCRAGGIKPGAVVLVSTVRALKHHGGLAADSEADRKKGLEAVESGIANLHRHLGIVGEFGVPAVVAVNRRPEDSDEEVELVTKLATEGGAFAAAVSDGFAQGGKGVADLAEAVVAACDQPNDFRFLYDNDEEIKPKVERIAERVYGASEVVYYLEAEKKIQQFTDQGLAGLPLCMAKTPLSLSADPEMLGAPTGFQLPVRDVRAYTGAGWLVPLCGAIQQMPGLGKSPAAFNVDIDAEGRTVGLFLRPCLRSAADRCGRRWRRSPRARSRLRRVSPRLSPAPLRPPWSSSPPGWPLSERRRRARDPRARPACRTSPSRQASCASACSSPPTRMPTPTPRWPNPGTEPAARRRWRGPASRR